MKVWLVVLLGIVSFSAFADCMCNRNRITEDTYSSPYYMSSSNSSLYYNRVTRWPQNRNPNGESFGNYSPNVIVGGSDSSVAFTVGGN
jgi:hypothetical protein